MEVFGGGIEGWNWSKRVREREREMLARGKRGNKKRESRSS